MQTGVLVGLAALAILGVGVVGASGIMAPTEGMQGGMGGGMTGVGSGMHNGAMMGDGTCDCQNYEYCQQHMYEHNYTWDHGGMMP